ncbi:Hypothetical protein SRAE_2000107300 [Strongyloides ratti]|uniref:Uncharacterized protein n=1 Tax=Strongyloides ratti TaxID=34506 RepID=A0A090MY17_STRRB|nr:Hypothetical protein SRAE_2000107300 [Strongyloides ratti]CEF66404.1 Hypothetical protein SRAE_2000107300 [Strongyloides ratti]
MQFRDYRNLEYNKSAPLLILLNDDQDIIDSIIIEESLRMSKYEKETLWIRNDKLNEVPKCDILSYSAKETSLVKIIHVQPEMSLPNLILDFCSTIQNKLQMEFYQILVDLREWSISASEYELTGMLALLSDTALYILSKRNENLKIISTQISNIQSSFPITVFLSQQIGKENMYMTSQFSSNVKVIGKNKDIVNLNIDDYC